MTQQTTQTIPKQLKTHVDLYKTFTRKEELTVAEFRLILKYFHNLWRKSIIYEGKIYALPLYLGSLGIMARKPTKHKIMNYQHYKETGIKAYRLNLHAQGLIASVKRIVHQTMLVKNMHWEIAVAYRFEACRNFNREIAKAIRDKNTIGLYQEYELRND